MLTFALMECLCERSGTEAEPAKKSRERSGAVSGSRKNERNGTERGAGRGDHRNRL